MGRNSYYLCEKDHPVKIDLFGSHISDIQCLHEVLL